MKKIKSITLCELKRKTGARFGKYISGKPVLTVVTKLFGVKFEDKTLLGQLVYLPRHKTPVAKIMLVESSTSDITLKFRIHKKYAKAFKQFLVINNVIK